MYRIIAILLLIGVVFTTTSLDAQSKKPMKGKVASFNDIMMGGDGTVDKAKAQELAEKGNPIVFVVGKGKSAKIYFVYNEDGTFAGKNLAKYANNQTVGVFGKTKTVNGIKIIIATMIESMD